MRPLRSTLDSTFPATQPGCRNTPPRPDIVRTGFTLLEVILALAILGGALAVLSEIMSLANRQAVDAQAESEAQIFAESIMDELIAGVLPLEDAREQQIETTDDVRWVYSIELSENELTDIQVVKVIVAQDLEARLRPAKYELIRWLSIAESSTTGAADSSTTSGSAGQSPSGTGGTGAPRG